MRILVVGDLHAPFIKEGALEQAKRIAKDRRIDEVVFMGDVVDNHALSYHESDPDGMSAGDELDKAIDALSGWYGAFPLARVCIGNHDCLPTRKAYSSGMPSRWIKSLASVLKTYSWQFEPYHEIEGWFFSHGLGQLVHTRAKDMNMNCVAGHVHSKFEARYTEGLWSVFAGCLIDDESYAMAYGKWSKKSKLGFVVIDTKTNTVEMIPFEELSV